MVFEARSGKEHRDQDPKRGFSDAAIELIDRDARGAVDTLRYLNRDRGVMVSIHIEDNNVSKPLRIPGGEALRRRRMRARQLKGGVSVLVIDTTEIHEGELHEGKVVKGTLFTLGSKTRTGHLDDVDVYPVTREIFQFPNFSHEPPLRAPQQMPDEVLRRHTDSLRELDGSKKVSDIVSTRTAAEVAEDDAVANSFVEWVENSYEGTRITFDVGDGFEEVISNPGSIALFNKEGQMKMLTFVPTHFETHCILVKQEQVGRNWLVTEYMVDRRERKRRIYKSTSTHVRDEESAGQGDTLVIPPFSYSQSPAPFTAQTDNLFRDGIMSDVISTTNRVDKAELDDLINLSVDVAKSSDDDLHR